MEEIAILAETSFDGGGGIGTFVPRDIEEFVGFT